MLEPRAPFQIVGARRPGEVVHVRFAVLVRRGAIGVVGSAALGAGRADDPAVRHRHPDVIDAEVGIELGRRVKLMTVPALFLEDAELGKPLHDEVVVADHAGSSERARNLGRPCHFHTNRLAWLDGLRQRHHHHRLIQRIPVIGRAVALARCEVDERRRVVAEQPDGGHLGPGPVLRRPPRQLAAAASHQTLTHPRGARVLPRVVIEMELQLRRGACRDVPPRDHLAAGQRAGLGVEANVDRVVRVPRGSRVQRLRCSCRSSGIGFRGCLKRGRGGRLRLDSGTAWQRRCARQDHAQAGEPHKSAHASSLGWIVSPVRPAPTPRAHSARV